MTEDLEKYRKISIHSLLGIQNSGRIIKIKCPFHPDKTPSCVIYPENSYNCFGCGKNGQNAIDFVVDLGFGFTETLEELEKHL